MDLPRYLTEKEVSKVTGFSVYTLRNWRNQKKGIPYLKMTKSIRYKPEDVCSYLEENRIEPANGWGK